MKGSPSRPGGKDAFVFLCKKNQPQSITMIVAIINNANPILLAIIEPNKLLSLY
jgi:hypothetical protein